MNSLRLLIVISLLICTKVFAQTTDTTINNFILKENLLKNNKVAVIATNEAEKPLESVNGTYNFSINGFQQDLIFHDGIAIAPQQISKSTFIYLKHLNDKGTHAKLYYVIKKEDNLNPIKISWIILIVIPLIIIGITIIFKRFIIIAIVLFIVLFFFNQNQGLHFSTFFESIYDGLKMLF